MADAPLVASPPTDGMPAGCPRRLAVATITIGLMMSVLSNSMTNLALPYIAQDLNITAASSIWIVNATQIALIISLLPVAALADIVGYRHVYRFGLVLFSVASIGCALAPSLPWLLAGRPFQGPGGRPPMGSLVLSMASWPCLFAVYAPLGLISFVLAERSLPHTTHPHRPFDVISAALSGATFGLLIFGIDGLAHGHQRLVIACELVLAAVLGTLFVWRQKRLADPMMPIGVFRTATFALFVTAAPCPFPAQGLAFVSLPFFFHTVLGRDATSTGILLTAWPLALATIAPIAGRLADRHHAGLLGTVGLTSMTAGLVLPALPPPNPSSADIMWRLVLCGAGFGVFASPNNRLMMNAVPRERSGSAGGIIATARTLGQTMGAALVAVVFGLFDFSSGGAADAARRAIWPAVVLAGPP